MHPAIASSESVFVSQMPFDQPGRGIDRHRPSRARDGAIGVPRRASGAKQRTPATHQPIARSRKA